MHGDVVALGSLRSALSGHGMWPYGLAGSWRSGHYTPAHLSGLDK